MNPLVILPCVLIAQSENLTCCFYDIPWKSPLRGFLNQIFFLFSGVFISVGCCHFVFYI